MRVLLVVLMLSAPVLTQEAEAPTFDTALVAAWRNTVRLADDAVSGRLAALVAKAPDEVQAYNDAVQKRSALIQGIQAVVARDAPGYTFNPQTGEIVPTTP